MTGSLKQVLECFDLICEVIIYNVYLYNITNIFMIYIYISYSTRFYIQTSCSPVWFLMKVFFLSLYLFLSIPFMFVLCLSIVLVFAINLLIDHSKAGKVVGSKGGNIQTLKTKSGCAQIRILKDPILVSGHTLFISFFLSLTPTSFFPLSPPRSSTAHSYLRRCPSKHL